MKTLWFYGSLLKTSIKASLSQRGAFLVSTVSMLLNNLIFFAIWWVFFEQFDDVGGWNFKEMAVLMTVALGGYGLMNICFGGMRDLARMIMSGDLDPYMTQPKNIFLHIGGSKSIAKGWGHILTSITLIAAEGLYSPFTLLLISIGIITAGIVFLAFNIIVHSLAFWLGSIEGMAKKYCDALFVFAVYPTNIYSGILLVVMFTVIPAGIISFFPVELVREFSWLRLFYLLGSSFLLLFISYIFFYRGLKRYESGNRFGVRF